MVVMSNAALEDDGVPDIKSMLTVGSPDRLNPAEGNQKFVRWERFLPKRSLRVLLVEHDDSTRHIVAALLRKCSYHVSAVGDGRKAWEVLKEKGYNFDLVLTEFEMPLLSGIVLLSKIVGSESCKNIPVIMMSSKDSVGIVHKCMLKGAVDFLVKPLRKNELRNLWQHVWRRHWSASYTCASENSIASNQFSSNASERSQADENSGKGDDDQSLDNKLNTNLVIFQKLDEILAKQSQSPNAEAHPVQPRNSMTTVLCSSVIEANGLLTDKTLVVGDATFLPNQVTSLIESNRANELDLIRCSEGDEKSNLLRQLNFHSAMKMTITEENEFSGAATCSQMKRVSNSSTLPLWDLFSSTKVNGSVEHHAKKQNILNHSSASAFTRYAGTYTKMVDQKENLPSACIRYNNCLNQQQSHVSYHGNVNLNCLLSPSRVPCQRFYIGDEAQLQPINYQDNTLISQGLAATGNGTSKIYSDQLLIRSRSTTELQHGLCHPISSWVQENDTKAEEQGGLLRAFREEEYGSSTCKNMLKDSGSIVTGEKTDADAATGTALQKRIESCIQNFDKKVTNSYRENALIKFRMKRKDRCFEKKVRYHNRKKLAEQRPRVKGQFVCEKVLRNQ